MASDNEMEDFDEVTGSDSEDANLRVYVALAIVVLRMKPATMSAFEFTRSLQQKLLAGSLKWRREKKTQNQQIVQLKRHLVWHCVNDTSDNRCPSATQPLTPSSSLQGTGMQLVPFSEMGHQERLLDACLVLNSCFPTPRVDSLPIRLDSLCVLLEFLKSRVIPFCVVEPHCEDWNPMGRLTVDTLIRLDHLKALPSLLGLLDASLEDLFKTWMQQFILSNIYDHQRIGTARRKRVADALRLLASGDHLRMSIILAIVNVLDDVTTELIAITGPSRQPLKVTTWENASILILLLEHLLHRQGPLPAGGRGTSVQGHISCRTWQKILTRCLCHLVDSFPLFVRWICRLTPHFVQVERH